jgi:hypothetical protein
MRLHATGRDSAVQSCELRMHRHDSELEATMKVDRSGPQDENAPSI